MIDALGYMEYNLASLHKFESLNQPEVSEIFLYYFELQRKYFFHKVVEFEGLGNILVDESYYVMNNNPRYKGKKVFFTGNVAKAYKEDILEFIRKPTEKYELIVPLLIVPTTEENITSYTISTQEDPVFALHLKSR